MRSEFAVFYLFIALIFTVPAYGFIEDDPGLYAEAFSIQAEALGTTLDKIGEVLTAALTKQIDGERGALRDLRSECDAVYERLAEWEDVPEEYVLCFANLKESAVAAGASVDALVEFIDTADPGARVRAAAKYELAFDAYSKALDSYPYLSDSD